MSKADSPTKLCQPHLEMGESRPMRARVNGVPMCSSHYNRARYAPERRHPKITVNCGWCGQPCERAPDKARKYAERFCTFACRDLWRIENDINACPADNRSSCPVPWRTCPHCGVNWYRHGNQARRCDGCTALVEAEWAERAETRRLHDETRRSIVAQQMEPRPCGDCGDIYTPSTTVQRYCTTRCARRVARRERRARECGASGSYTWTQVIGLFLLFGRRCAYCDQTIDGQPDPDHVIPLSRDGHNSIGNILPACRDCNCDKRDLLLHEWNADRARRGLPSRITTWSWSDKRYAHLTAQMVSEAA